MSVIFDRVNSAAAAAKAAEAALSNARSATAKAEQNAQRGMAQSQAAKAAAERAKINLRLHAGEGLAAQTELAAAAAQAAKVAELADEWAFEARKDLRSAKAAEGKAKEILNAAKAAHAAATAQALADLAEKARLERDAAIRAEVEAELTAAGALAQAQQKAQTAWAPVIRFFSVVVAILFAVITIVLIMAAFQGPRGGNTADAAPAAATATPSGVVQNGGISNPAAVVTGSLLNAGIPADVTATVTLTAVTHNAGIGDGDVISSTAPVAVTSVPYGDFPISLADGYPTISHAVLALCPYTGTVHSTLWWLYGSGDPTDSWKGEVRHILAYNSITLEYATIFPQNAAIYMPTDDCHSK